MRKELTFPPAMRRGNRNSKTNPKNRDKRKLSKKPLTQRLSPRAKAKPTTPLITMTQKHNDAQNQESAHKAGLKPQPFITEKSRLGGCGIGAEIKALPW